MLPYAIFLELGGELDGMVGWQGAKAVNCALFLGTPCGAAAIAFFVQVLLERQRKTSIWN